MRSEVREVRKRLRDLRKQEIKTRDQDMLEEMDLADERGDSVGVWRAARRLGGRRTRRRTNAVKLSRADWKFGLERAGCAGGVCVRLLCCLCTFVVARMRIVAFRTLGSTLLGCIST